MKKTILKVAVVALFFPMIFSACNKDAQENVQPEEVAVQDNNAGLTESDDVIGIVEEVMASNGSNMRTSSENQTEGDYCGATITITKNGDGTGKIVIDFGTGSTCDDGRTRKGKVLIDYVGKYRTAGSSQVITFDNYYVNDNRIDGKKTLTTTINNSGAYPIYATSIRVENGSIIYKDGKTAQWVSERTRIYDNKGTTLNFSDDEISISGTASGTSRDGNTYSVQITTPLKIEASCLRTSGWMPVTGVLEVTPTDGVKRTVGYGAGNCDRAVTITINGVSRNITVKKAV